MDPYDYNYILTLSKNYRNTLACLSLLGNEIGTCEEEPTEEFYMRDDKKLDKLFNKIPRLSRNITLYRGMRVNKDYFDNLKKLKNGDIIGISHNISTSSELVIANRYYKYPAKDEYGVLFIINAKQGSKILPFIIGLREILVSRLHKLLIKSVDYKRKYIYITADLI